MSTDKDFTILSFKMFKDIQQQHERIDLPYDSDEQIQRNLFEFCSFLESHQFADLDLPPSASLISQDFVLKGSHLIGDGRAFVRSVLTKWTKARNKNGLRVLEKAVQQFRI